MYITPEDGTRSVRTRPVRRRRAAADRHRRALHARQPATSRSASGGWPPGRASTSRRSDDQPPLGRPGQRPDRHRAAGRPLHPAARHTYVATGFGGWGMSGGIMAGQLLAADHRRAGRAWSDLYDPRRCARGPRGARRSSSTRRRWRRHFVGDRLRAATADAVDARRRRATARSSASAAAAAPSTGTRTAPLPRRLRHAAPTSAASSPSTPPSTPGSAPATAPAGPRRPGAPGPATRSLVKRASVRDVTAGERQSVAYRHTV